ncbi:MAG TPA: ABC transporter ATP-binding protein [Candidatus Cryosericum sp.]|nr:ABC transporter ATP-binding protein [Candidatus Cryosericum sp.]
MGQALVVSELRKSYGGLEALHGISFEVAPGEIFALIGPNGAGKTTTLRIVATILQPTSGSASVYGMDVQRQAAAVREIISYLPEEAGAYKNLTGLGYLNFMADLFAADSATARTYVDTATAISGLGERLHDKIGTYSKGMTRKLLLSRVVMTSPKLAIIDEPTSGLDVVAAIDIRESIRKAAQAGMAVLLSSHNMLEIEYLSDRVAIVDKGTIHEVGSPTELKDRYGKANLEEVFVEVVQK